MGTFPSAVSAASLPRGSGVLLHITSLPSAYGIGDLGPQAYAFADFLAGSGQCLWQVLPLNPTDLYRGNSPYSSVSAFAGNTLLISPDLLHQDGLLSKTDLEPAPVFPESHCDFPAVVAFKSRLLELACRNFGKNKKNREGFERFCVENASWLEDFSHFIVIRNSLAGMPWVRWPKDLRDRSSGSLEAVRRAHRHEFENVKIRQYLFFDHWQRLRARCAEKQVMLLGDLAIYVTFDSSDVWAHPQNFKLGRDNQPEFVSGVPPDYFSSTGQLWGTPVYNWEEIHKDGFSWWGDRIGHCLGLFDILRIDHFRGLVAYWEVPAGEETALNGRWVDVPVDDFFCALNKRFSRLPLVAEDLGTITPDVRQVMERFGLPGMKVMLFAFSEDKPDHPYLPHTYERNCLAYTGTHDNNTVRGWFEDEASVEDKERFFRYCGRKVTGAEAPWEFIRLLMDSAADQVVVPMQDILCLGGSARMNRPSVCTGNWEWRVQHNELTAALSEKLFDITRSSGRSAE